MIIADQAFILHKKPYKDSSELIKLLTREHGVIDAICKGSRRPKSKFNGQLQPFIPTEVSLTGRSTLKTLVQAEQMSVAKSCAYINHVSMLYCNELMILMNLDEDAVTALFSVYQQAIERLFEVRSVSLTLRRFEWHLCCELGYELIVPVDATSDATLVFNPENGLECGSTKNACSVAAFKAFIGQQALHPSQLKQINHLMKMVVNHLVHGKPIKSRELLR